MKKFILALFSFSMLFSIKAYCADYTENWINCRSHDYSTWDNPFCVYQYNNGNYDGNRGFFQDTNQGIIISYASSAEGAASWGFHEIWYLSFSDTAVANWQTRDNPPTLSSCITGHGTSLPSIFSGFDTGGKTVYWAYYQNNNLWDQNVNADLYVTGSQDLYDQLEAMDWDTSTLDPDRINGLPMLTFTCNQDAIYKFPVTFDTKLSLTWNYSEKEPYKSSVGDYVLDVNVSGRLDSLPHLTDDMSMDASHLVVLSNGGTPVGQNVFSFAFLETGKKFYQTYGYNQFPYHDNNSQGMAEGYRLYVRTRHLKSGETSAWKIFTCQGGALVPSGYAQDDSDSNNPNTVKPVPQQDRDSNTDNYGYDKDNSTTAQSDPTGQNFEGTTQVDAGNIVSTLKSLSVQLQELPSIGVSLAGFLPQWLITLIALSIGLCVVIGVVKVILK